ncbi:MAG: TDT family transporter, partial [Peptococcaceae bacterium]
YASTVQWFYIGFAAVLWLLLLFKIVLYWPQIRCELQNPLTCSVFEAFFMTLLQFSAVLAVLTPELALVMWFAANVGHAILVLYFSWNFLRDFQLKHVYTTWNVLYGGNMLAAVFAPLFQMEQAGPWIFWIGFFLFLPWYPISFYRYRKLPVSESARPTLCILAAPFNLTLAGYLSCGLQPDWHLAILFAVIGQVMYGYVLFHLPAILRLPFYPSYGALTFPFVIPAVALQKLLVFCRMSGLVLSDWMQYIVWLEQGIAVVMVTYALLRYLQYFWNSCSAKA